MATIADQVAAGFGQIAQVLPAAARRITITRTDERYDPENIDETATTRSFSPDVIFGSEEVVEGEKAPGVTSDNAEAINKILDTAYLQTATSTFTPLQGDSVTATGGSEWVIVRVKTDSAKLVHILSLERVT